MVNEGVKTPQIAMHFDFRWSRALCSKYCGHRAGTTQAASTESVNLRSLVGVARLEAIAPIGKRPALLTGHHLLAHRTTLSSAGVPTLL